MITPSPQVMAVVRHADPPELVPDELLAYVEPNYIDERLDDWSLTGDVVAFGGVDTIRTYQRWRATWERAWPLDPRSSLARLTAISRDVRSGPVLDGELLTWFATEGAAGPRTIDDPAELLRLADEIEAVRDDIRERDRTGYGFVDVTEGHKRVGLARAWSGSAGPEVLAADDHLEATMRPASGLHVEINGAPGRSVGPVDEVIIRSSGVEVIVADVVTRLDAGESAALTWIVPGAARWRVREIPEVLVWARTFGGLPECCRYAAALRRPVTLRDDESAPRDH